MRKLANVSDIIQAALGEAERISTVKSAAVTPAPTYSVPLAENLQKVAALLRKQAAKNPSVSMADVAAFAQTLGKYAGGPDLAPNPFVNPSDPSAATPAEFVGGGDPTGMGLNMAQYEQPAAPAPAPAAAPVAPKKPSALDSLTAMREARPTMFSGSPFGTFNHPVGGASQ